MVGVEAQAAGRAGVTSTGVTEETDITGNVTFLELGMSASTWAKKIIKINDSFSRHDMFEYIHNNGYDITETAKWLQQFYINKHYER